MSNKQWSESGVKQPSADLQYSLNGDKVLFLNIHRYMICSIVFLLSSSNYWCHNFETKFILWTAFFILFCRMRQMYNFSCWMLGSGSKGPSATCFFLLMVKFICKSMRRWDDENRSTNAARGQRRTIVVVNRVKDLLNNYSSMYVLKWLY